MFIHLFAGFALLQTALPLPEIEAQISDPAVQNLIEVWNGDDAEAYMALFTDDAEVIDAGREVGAQFFADVVEIEWFTAIESAEDDGRRLTGRFFDERYGEMNIYMNTWFNEDGLIERLEIGFNN